MSSALHVPTLPKAAPQAYQILMGLWLFSMIALPILRWNFGDGILPLGVSISVMLQVIAVLAILGQQWSAYRTVLIIVIVLPFSWLIELIGSSTGLPFGHYHYTAQLVPQIAQVPLLIPLAWLMMLPPAWAVAYTILRRFSGWTFCFLSALALTAWDLFLDPQMVAWGFWVWEAQTLPLPDYFGIPLINFIGWVFSAMLLTWLVLRAVELDSLPTGPLLLIYMLTWLLETGGLAVLWGLIGPALCGFIGMGGLISWACWSEYQRVLKNDCTVQRE